jgi:hypothetical protein
LCIYKRIYFDKPSNRPKQPTAERRAVRDARRSATLLLGEASQALVAATAAGRAADAQLLAAGVRRLRPRAADAAGARHWREVGAAREQTHYCASITRRSSARLLAPERAVGWCGARAWRWRPRTPRRCAVARPAGPGGGEGQPGGPSHGLCAAAVGVGRDEGPGRATTSWSGRSGGRRSDPDTGAHATLHTHRSQSGKHYWNSLMICA